jgi:hypothetical protein
MNGINLNADQATLAGFFLAMWGGMVHKIFGPALERLAGMGLKFFYNRMERKLMSSSTVTPGMTAPTSVTSAKPSELETLTTDILTGASVAAVGASTVGTAVSASKSAGTLAEIESGLASFLSFAAPILETVAPAEAALVSGIVNGLQTIITAVKTHGAL